MWVGDLHVARADRALADHARHSTLTALCRLAADAVQHRLCTLDQLQRQVDRGRFPGRAVLRRAVERLGNDHSHSGSERLGRTLLRGDGVVVPRRPGTVYQGERPVAEIDIPFFSVCYGVEVDGPHHLFAQQAARDRDRDRMLLRDHGLHIDRFFWFELEEQPARFVREVRTRLRALGYPSA